MHRCKHSSSNSTRSDYLVLAFFVFQWAINTTMSRKPLDRIPMFSIGRPHTSQLSCCSYINNQSSIRNQNPVLEPFHGLLLLPTMNVSPFKSNLIWLILKSRFGIRIICVVPLLFELVVEISFTFWGTIWWIDILNGFVISVPAYWVFTWKTVTLVFTAVVA